MPTRSALKHEQLLQTAAGLFRQHGIRRVSVEEICRRAGISKATFYKHYANRGELAVAVFDQLVAPLRAQLDAELFGSQPFGERLQRLQEIKRSGFALWGPALLQEMLEDPLPELKAWLDRERGVSYALALRFFQSGQASGEVNPALPPAFFPVMLEFLEAMYHDARIKALFPDHYDRNELINQLMMNGLSTPPQEV